MTDTVSITDNDTHVRRKPAHLLGIVPAHDVESYDSVPWYRRRGVALFPLFAPVLILIALTGDVYAKPTRAMRAHSDASVWRYRVTARLYFVAVALLATVVVATSLAG